MNQFDQEPIRHFFFSAKVFLLTFISLFIMQLLSGLSLYLGFMQTYLFTSYTILLPGICLVFSGEKPLNPIGYSVCVVLFIIISGFTSYNISKSTSWLNSLVKKTDLIFINVLSIIIIILILMYPYYKVIDFF